MRNKAISSGVWSFVEPASLTPTWVHFDRRSGPPACSAGGYPLLRQGSRGNYVLILQDSLNNLGYRTGGLDGLFGPTTANSVRAYQTYKGLTADGIVGCNTWNALMRDVVGRGRTSSTID
ncbi:MAG: peptidoglycan-binding protein [Firmicutes bacterium]|nr:peptidoglycan-binding protein [Bacillota bacterium]